MKEPCFLGAATAIVTPFINDEIDYIAYDRLLSQQLDAGIDAIVVCGTTGEASTMDAKEKLDLLRHTVFFVGGRCKVIAGSGTNSTASSVALSKEAHDCGADALLVVTPYYNKCSQSGLIAHYFAIADTVDIPMIVYNVPTRTGVTIRPETCLALSKHPNINGIKEASGSISQVARILNLCGDDFHVWSGNDDQTTATMALGGAGVISVLSNICPNAVVQTAHSCLAGNFAESAKLQRRYMPLIDALFSDVNPIPVKTALHELGLCNADLRMPLSPISDELRAKLCEVLAKCPDTKKPPK
ncbi:MAG: 4-hydroxy-tetrahydrodipicolinate synthase [Oscillospiraceae bacterium]|jgi:4-hydroxy-tetrahydrodipicolinate synthase|nr:4-hydroxy-tetrahydrodipicolinate synthase [Oscillospiraceae bacterium]